MHPLQNQAGGKRALNRRGLIDRCPGLFETDKTTMQKLSNPQMDNSGNSKNVEGISYLEERYETDFDDRSYNSKMKVECICPKCGQRHVLAFHWIGRGIPRKYCQSCKGGYGG